MDRAVSEGKGQIGPGRITKTGLQNRLRISGTEEEDAMKLSTTLIRLANLGKFIRRRHRLTVTAAVLLLANGVITSCAPAASMGQLYSSENMSTPNNLPTPTLSAPIVSTPSVLYDESMLVSLYERTMPSVVKIEAVIKRKHKPLVLSSLALFNRKGKARDSLLMNRDIF